MKHFAKSIARMFAKVAVAPSYALYRVIAHCSDRDRTFQLFSQAFSSFPGVFGEYLRAAFYRRTLASCEPNVVISYGTIFSSPQARIGNAVYIGAYCIIGRATIGDDCLIASRVSIVSGTRQHGISDLSVPIREQPGEFVQISLGRNCWVGEGAVVAADIGEGAVVGLGSVVTKPVAPYDIVSGNPAVAIRNRREQVEQPVRC